IKIKAIVGSTTSEVSKLSLNLDDKSNVELTFQHNGRPYIYRGTASPDRMKKDGFGAELRSSDKNSRAKATATVMVSPTHQLTVTGTLDSKWSDGWLSGFFTPADFELHWPAR